MILAAGISAILMSLTISFIVTALVKHRGDDFLKATATEHFSEADTCVEVITKKMLKVRQEAGKTGDRGSGDGTAADECASIHVSPP